MILISFTVTMAVGFLAHWHVRRTYSRHGHTCTIAGYTGVEAAPEILRQVGISNAKLVEHDEFLGDHCDPGHRRLALSSANYHANSPTALGVTIFASQLMLWIPLLGMFTGLLAAKTGLVIMAAAWGVLILFNLVFAAVLHWAKPRIKTNHMRFLQHLSS